MSLTNDTDNGMPDMRRLLLASLLLTGACLGGATAPSAVSQIEVSSNVQAGGVFVGDHVQINAAPLDINGNVVPVAITFSSSNPSVATIDGSGLIIAVGAGITTINVSGGGQTVHLVLTVDGNVVQSVEIAPPVATIAVGTKLPLTAQVLTTLGNPARNKTLNWSTSDATKATVDTTGVVTAVAHGSAVSICAALADAPAVSGCASITVQ